MRYFISLRLLLAKKAIQGELPKREEEFISYCCEESTFRRERITPCGIKSYRSVS